MEQFPLATDAAFGEAVAGTYALSASSIFWIAETSATSFFGRNIFSTGMRRPPTPDFKKPLKGDGSVWPQGAVRKTKKPADVSLWSGRVVETPDPNFR
jgi:hypothetical protein